jgi:hypothetical protein
MISYPRIQISCLSEQILIHRWHLAGALRGLICCRCNNLLGMANDDPRLLLRGAHYLIDMQEKTIAVLANEKSSLG